MADIKSIKINGNLIVDKNVTINGIKPTTELYVKIGTDGLLKTGTIEKLNIQDGSGENSIKQKPDGDTFKGQQKAITATDVFVDYNTDAAGQNSTILGGKNRAEGKRATAIGGYNVAVGPSSLATGEQTITEGRCSFTAGQKTRAAGWSSMAIGTSTLAAGNTAFSGGIKTTASGDYSVSLGSNTIASGLASMAIGDTSQANGHASFSGGIKNLIANTSTAGDALGGYNTVESRYASARGASNFIKASYPTDVSGGGGSGTGGSGGETTQPTEELQPGLYSTVEGNRNTVYGAWSSAKGANNVIYSHCSTSEGYNNIIGTPVTSLDAAGDNDASMHAEGANNRVTGKYAHVGGFNSTASGEASFAHGKNATATGDCSVALSRGKATGLNSFAAGAATASGTWSVATGYNTAATGENSAAFNLSTIAKHQVSTAFGYNTETTSNYQLVCGSFNKDDDYSRLAAFVVGNGTEINKRSNAFMVCKDGRAKVQTAPKDNEDVARKLELDTKFDKSGGTIAGNVSILGNLTVGGTTDVQDTIATKSYVDSKIAIKSASLSGNILTLTI